MTEEKKQLSWVDLSEEELVQLSDVSVCMYNKQKDPNVDNMS